MNRNEKLLEAIGQIDDRLILDAQKAGAGYGQSGAVAGGTHAADGTGHSVRAVSGDSARGAHTGSARKKSSRRRAAMLRFQGALAACAVLAICVGVYGLLSSEGLLLSPFDKSARTEIASDSAAEMKAESAAMEEAAPEEAAASPEVLRTEAAEGADESVTVSAEEGSAAGNTAESAGENTSGTASQKSGESAVTGDGTAQTENADTTETAEPEICLEETAEVEIASLEGAEAESGAEVYSEEKGSVWSRRSSAQEVSDNDMELSQELKENKLASKLVKISDTDVTVSFSNQYAEATVTYGTAYGLERQTADGWTKVSEKENVAWTDIQYELEAGKSATETVRLSSIFGTLENGHYRLVKNCTVTAADQSQKELTVYTEFDITK